MLALVKKNKLSSLIGATTLITIVLSFLLYQEISLLHFINISFFFCYAYISIGILFYIVNKGFFDGISHSFRKLFKRNNREDESEEIIPLSELMTIPHGLLLKSGLILTVFMGAALYVYYL